MDSEYRGVVIGTYRNPITCGAWANLLLAIAVTLLLHAINFGGITA